MSLYIDYFIYLKLKNCVYVVFKHHYLKFKSVIFFQSRIKIYNFNVNSEQYNMSI